MRNAMVPQGRVENRGQLESMQRIRRELEVQVEALTDRRGELMQERLNAQATNNNTVATQIDGQIKEISDRLGRLERQKLQIDDAIMDAVRRGVGTEQGQAVEIAQVPPVPPPAPIEFTHVPESPPSWFGPNAERLVAMNAAVLLLLGFFTWRAIRRAGRRPDAAALQSVDHLRQAVDSIAVEVERISENQRYVTKLLADRGQLGEALPSNAKDRVEASKRSG